MKNFDFYIYYRRFEVGPDAYISLHFSSDGEMQDHSDEGATIEAHDLKAAYDGFCSAYHYIFEKEYDSEQD